MKMILEIEGLSKSYDGKYNALSDCSFALEAGKICAVVGESGSGKSTLLRLIAGLERPDRGCIKIKGETVSDDMRITPPQQRRLGLVFQDFALFPHLTVEQNIAFGVQTNAQETVRHLLQLIKMEGYAKTYPAELSGGQEQRVAIARTMALQPELLLLDEPFSNLDAGLKTELRREIRHIMKNFGASMIFITHDLFDAIDIADDIVFLRDGIMLQHCTITDLSENDHNAEVQKIIADARANAERVLELVQREKPADAKS